MKEKNRDWKQWIKDNPTDDDYISQKIDNHKKLNRQRKAYLWWKANESKIKDRIRKQFDLKDDYPL